MIKSVKAIVLVTMMSAAASAGTVDFDGKAGGAISPAETVRRYAAESSRPEAMMPSRPSPEFTVFQQQAINGAINDALRRNRNNPGLAANLRCLKNSSFEEKAKFAYARPGQTYKFPAACYARNEKGLLDDITDAVGEWICETVTTTVCVFTCTFGEGDTETATNCYNDCDDVVVESCHQK